MNGLLKGKKPGTQFLILISITLCSFFIVGMLFTVMLAQMSGVSLETLSDSKNWSADDPGIIMVVRGMLLIQFIFLCLVPVYICSRLFSTNKTEYLGLVRPHKSYYFLIGAVLLLLALPLTTYIGELNKKIIFPAGIAEWMKAQEESAAQSIKVLLTNQSVTDLLLNIVTIAGFAAVGEELLFRGMAQRILIRMFKSPWAGIIIAAFIFSAMHVQFYGFFPRFILGILLGALYWYSGSLWTAIISHFIYDAALIIIAYFNPAMIADTNADVMKGMVIPALISAVVVIALLYWMKNNSSSRYPDDYADDAIPVKNHPF